MGSVKKAEWSHFGEKLLPRSTMYSLSIMFIYCLVISHIDFEDMRLILIVTVPGHCFNFGSGIHDILSPIHLKLNDQFQE